MSDLPDATAITAGVAFINAIWTGFGILGTLFAVVAVLKVGPYVLRKMSSLLPGTDAYADRMAESYEEYSDDRASYYSRSYDD